jgi:DNA-binding protein Fis
MGETELPMEVTESIAYETKYERLRNRIAKYCLPDQVDKVMLTVLADIQGYDAQDTYRNVTHIITELASDNLGINP